MEGGKEEREEEREGGKERENKCKYREYSVGVITAGSE